ncbi:MOSC domain-containing protein [Arthrobacter sulfonylureivorans]|uniref:MOSC domain-containing protein n=1 Tax=Arthrobacter sulfonylureivorans TaxID=2486855 RepID=UPI0039E428F9
MPEPATTPSRDDQLPSGLLLALCRLHALKPDASTVGITGIDKRPVAGRIPLHSMGLRADLQADRKNHGGELKALYAYAQEDAAAWADELRRDIPPGLFGENLRTTGVQVSGALVGERWQVGPEVVVEVTMPRIPCATFARHMDEPRWVKRFLQKGLPGTYLKVVTAGSLAAGDGIRVLFRPGHGVSVAESSLGLTPEQAQALLASEAAGEITLHGNVRKAVHRALNRDPARGRVHA